MTLLDTILFGSPPVAAPGVGSHEDIVLGSGDSFASFPGLIQYNGLLMNDNQAFDYYHVESIDGVDDAELRDFRANKPFDDGEDPYGTLYSGRPIVINGQIRSYHVWKIDDMRTALKSAFAVRGGFGLTNPERPLWFRTGDPAKDRIVYCKKVAKVEIPMAQPTAQNGWLPYMIPLRASDPRMLSYLLHTHTQDGAGGFNLINAGDYSAKVLMRFYGPCTTMTLERSFETLVKTVVVGPIASGDYVEILGSRIVDQDGNNAYNLYSDDSDRMTLGPGDNDLSLTGTGLGSGSSVVVQWRDSWV